MTVDNLSRKHLKEEGRQRSRVVSDHGSSAITGRQRSRVVSDHGSSAITARQINIRDPQRDAYSLAESARDHLGCHRGEQGNPLSKHKTRPAAATSERDRDSWYIIYSCSEPNLSSVGWLITKEISNARDQQASTCILPCTQSY